MKKIFKYTIEESEPTIEMPKGAEILSFREQYKNGLCVWALVDTDKEKEERKFIIYGTGHEIKNPDDLKYIGNAFMGNGMLVWHLFEVIK